MKNRRICWPNHRLSTIFCAALVASALTLIVSVAAAQEKIVQIKTVAPAYTNPTSGSEMYVSYCAACHGVNGRGNGPAAPAFNRRPTNLTLLAKSHGGKFPQALVSSTLQRGTKASGHGDAQMPNWNDAFRNLDGANQGVTRLRINNLTAYIESLQAK